MSESCVEIDVRKAFTHAFNKITKIPIFTQFDVWKPFDYKKHDYQELHELTLYLVKPKNATMFFNKSYCLIYGTFLKHFADQCEIIYFKQPYRTCNVDYKKITKDLWATEISDNYLEDIKAKKTIANVNFGLLEKSTNTSTKSFAFDNLREALYHQSTVGGKINKVSGFYEDDDEVEQETERKHYCLTVSDRANLRNGYIYIKELLLQHHNFKMQQDYDTLKANDIDVWSVKTDAMTIRREHLNKARRVLRFNERIGGWRHEKGKHIAEPHDKHKQKENTLIDIPTYTNEVIPVEDEWDTEAIARSIIPRSPVMIRSKYPGGGKSHIAKHFSKLGYKVLFVVPQNSLSQSIEDDAITTNKFFAIPVGDGEKLPEFDHSSYNCIVFDEIYMNGLHVRSRINEFCHKHPEKIIIGAGDVKQLPPIEDLTNTRNPDEYSEDCINQIFKYQIFLKICKRLGGKDDPKANQNRRKLDMMYVDMWVHRIPMTDFVHKYFKTTDDPMASLKNIAYTNMRCLNVSNYIRKQQGKTEKYLVGETLICRVYKKLTSNDKFNVNYRFKIVRISGTFVILENVKTKQQYHTDVQTLDKHFRYDYCTTCHSAQGASIKGKIVIHEWEKKHLVSREWIWCAMTRSTDFNDVLFFASANDPSELNEENLHRYIENKIKNYKLQDEVKQRKIEGDKYVDHDWFIRRINGNCQNCGCRFEFDVKNGCLTNNMTAQRLNNEIPHYKENCEAWCKLCNCSAK